MADAMPQELRDLVVDEQPPAKANGKGKGGRPSGAARRAAEREAKAQLQAAELQAKLANQAGLAALLQTAHAMLGLDIPDEMTAALSGALMHAVSVTWPNISPVAVAWGQVAVLAGGIYGPAVARLMMQPGQPAELEPAQGAEG